MYKRQHRALAAVGVELDGAGIGTPCALERHCYVSCVAELLGLKQAGGVDGVGRFAVRAGINAVAIIVIQSNRRAADGQRGHPSTEDVVVRVLQNGNDGVVVAMCIRDSYNADMEAYITRKLIESQMKLRLDR